MGKLNANDEGETDLQIGTESGRVVIKFAKPVAWIGFPPEQAIALAEVLIKHARSCATQPLTLRIGDDGKQ